MSRAFLWNRIKAELRDLAWRMTQGSRSARRLERYTRRAKRIAARVDRRARHAQT